LVLVLVALPFFNDVADKKLALLWSNPVFWLLGIGVCIITGLIAGSYPALYLSSFQPVKVLKGTFRAGRFAAIPRKVLVVLQFSVSVILIIGTMVVYKQIQHAKNRPIGYNRESLLQVSTNDVIHGKFETLRNELKSSNVIVDITESVSPATSVWNSNGGFEWEGKDPNLAVDFPNNGVTYDFGKVLGWEIKEGRDFSRAFATDSAAFIINESAVKFMGLKDPVGKTVKWNDKPFTVIGVVKDMLAESPYEPVRASFYHISPEQGNVITVRVNPDLAPSDALAKLENTFKRYDPASVFEFSFVDEEFARKFGEEERIGKLTTCFAFLAVLISCLGLFGLASFVAEQRTKEIGIRKVLGATVANLWHLLSKQFVLLVCISLLVSIPLAYYFMQNWLQHYTYRTGLPWWIFVAAGAGALAITMLTVSFQAIKAARSNPVKSLRTE
jgi:ABC-type antimicrobial peptide transport system permease subunit